MRRRNYVPPYATLDIFAEVVNRKTIPNKKADPEGYFQYVAEKLTASAVTQTYHYMVEGGLQYGLLTTGEMIVFLRINWDEPETLLFHLAEPGAETVTHSPHDFFLCTAVGQYLAFSLMALQSSPHRQEDRQNATAKLKPSLEDFGRVRAGNVS
ncbi:Protein kinase-like domain protein [Ophiocordyceps sinensis CO18]|uniref:Protein kinase-like domain protein n=1 Tax=Ophiocordyceps sinensis (strain Co18 / CGMCC 3.14243) TaxID=911162 RepID=T5A382_OPHSC|nr:Protein kinase-like domain protein [Ophiocordyceps sinensis CO18]